MNDEKTNVPSVIDETDLRVTDILLWDENSRLTDNLFGKNEQDIINTFLANERKFQVLKLAEEIVAEFELPQLEQIVVYQKDDEQVVCEGNRRVAVYKCLINPSLAGDHRASFEALKIKTGITADFSLHCIITDDFEKANKYIERKHLRNNNEKGWGQVERDRHSVRGKKDGMSSEKARVKRAAIAGLVDKLALPDEMKRDVLGEGKVTNFYRIVDSTPGSDYFGYTAEQDGNLNIKDESKLLAKLKAFAFELLTSKPTSGESWSRAYNKTQEKADYLASLDASTLRLNKIDQQIEDSKSQNLLGEEEINIKPQGRTVYTSLKPKEYPTLIKPTLKRPNLSSKSDKISEVHAELKKVIVKDCPTAVSVLVRVLLEVTVFRFLEVNGERFDGENNLIVAGEGSKTQLKQKIDYISAKYAATNSKVKGAISVLNADLYTKNLNQVAHNIGYFADEVNIRRFWKNIETIFEFMIEGIIEKENDSNKNT